MIFKFGPFFKTNLILLSSGISASALRDEVGAAATVLPAFAIAGRSSVRGLFLDTFGHDKEGTHLFGAHLFGAKVACITFNIQCQWSLSLDLYSWHPSTGDLCPQPFVPRDRFLLTDTGKRNKYQDQALERSTQFTYVLYYVTTWSTELLECLVLVVTSFPRHALTLRCPPCGLFTN